METVTQAGEHGCSLHTAHLSVDAEHPDVTPSPFIGGIAAITNSPACSACLLPYFPRAMGSVVPMLAHVTHVATEHTASGSCLLIPPFTQLDGGTVTTENGMTTISAAFLDGKIDLFATNVTISAGSFINALHLDCYRTHYLPSRFDPPFTGPFSRQDRDIVRMENRDQREPIYWQRNASRDQPSQITHYVLLEKEATLHQFTFTGDRCELTLEEGAHYTGFRWPNLHIITSPTSA